MTESEKADDWVRYFKAIQYSRMGTLQAVLRNDGERVLDLVLKRLGLVSASDVVKATSDTYPH